MTVCCIHHLGLSVADLTGSIELLRARGIDGGEPFGLSGADAARGNGLDDISMQVAFVSDGTSTFELIEHLEHVAEEAAPGPADRGFGRWHVLPPGGAAALDLPGAVIRPVLPGGRVSVGLTAADPAATDALLDALGLTPGTDGWWSLPGAAVRAERATSSAQPVPVTARGRSHLALRVDDARATHARLGAAGFDCISAPIDHEGAIWWFFVRDPGGSGEIEIVQDDT